ncbi:MAG: outer membrane lipoprotein carrier protein LolA [Elusimicrobia bacterium]|nr:outer membrane lipoprotein carrier protein LolA [Elusimicrobiota bacterium]
MKKPLFVLLFLVSAALWAQETPQTPEPNGMLQESPAQTDDAYAQEIIARFGAVETLQSQFTQEKHLVLLTEPVESKGAFAFSKKGAQLRWEYTEPFQNGFLMDGGKTYRLEKGVKKTVKGVMSRNTAAQMLVWLTFDLKTLSETYAISYFEGGVTLTPKNDKNRLLDKITVWFAKDNPQALSEIRMDEPGGDFTLLKFSDTQINKPLPKDAFL